MKWFKHDTDAAEDPKIKKLKRKYGMTGYGIYFNVLELIARDIDDHLDEIGFLPKDWDDEELSVEFGLSSDTLRPVINYMCEVGLFKMKGNRLYNDKIESRCDDYTARILRNKANVRTKYEHSTNSVRPDKIRLDKIRIDYKEGELEEKLKKQMEYYDDIRQIRKNKYKHQISKEQKSMLIAVGLLWVDMCAKTLNLKKEEIPILNIYYPIRKCWDREQWGYDNFKDLFHYFLSSNLPKEDKISFDLCMSVKYVAKFKLAQSSRPKLNSAISSQIPL